MEFIKSLFIVHLYGCANEVMIVTDPNNHVMKNQPENVIEDEQLHPRKQGIRMTSAVAPQVICSVEPKHTNTVVEKTAQGLSSKAETDTDFQRTRDAPHTKISEVLVLVKECYIDHFFFRQCMVENEKAEVRQRNDRPS